MINNKYKAIYDDIINRARSRVVTSEHSHIFNVLPDLDNEIDYEGYEDNVMLTPKEYYLCMLLLTKVYDTDKLAIVQNNFRLLTLSGYIRNPFASSNSYQSYVNNKSKVTQGLGTVNLATLENQNLMSI